MKCPPYCQLAEYCDHCGQKVCVIEKDYCFFRFLMIDRKKMCFSCHTRLTPKPKGHINRWPYKEE